MAVKKVEKTEKVVKPKATKVVKPKAEKVVKVAKVAKTSAAQKVEKVEKAEKIVKAAKKTNEVYFYAVGRRKTSVAQVRLFEDDKATDSDVVINGKKLKEYFPAISSQNNR